jgi:hypothetical protein
MEQKIEQLKQLEHELDIASKKAYEEVDNLQQSINNKILEIFNFENKFIKIADPIDGTQYTYMFCDWVSRGRGLSNEIEIGFRGYGFCSEITRYKDATWASWDEMKERHFLERYGYIKILKYITVITEEEFNAAFNDMILKLIARHKENMYEIKETGTL